MSGEGQRSSTTKRRVPRAIAYLAATALVASAGSLLLLGDGDEVSPIAGVRGGEGGGAEERHRALRLPDPKSVAPAKRTLPNDGGGAIATEGDGGQQKATVTIYVTDWRGWAVRSAFMGGLLERYGTGRVDYRVVYDRYTSWSGSKAVVPHDLSQGPCLATSIPNLEDMRGSHEALVKHYGGTCKTMVTGDEKCLFMDYDARGYYSDDAPEKGYLPLGPRYDSWLSFQAINPESILPPSQRKIKLNGIFSTWTNSGRKELAKVLNKHAHENVQLNWEVFTQMSRRGGVDPNDPNNAMLETDGYMRVLLDSVFTLSPFGKSPDCFRLYEAVEAGSIPVIAVDEFYRTFTCKDTLKAWREGAPIVILSSWTELYPTLKGLLDDPEGLDRRQRELMEWYDGYMRGSVAGFEDFLIGDWQGGESGEGFEVA